MSSIESLRAVVRAQHLSELLRRSEFHAILGALAPDEAVRALAPGELRGRQGYLVATDQRVFFVHAGVAGTMVAPVAASSQSVQYLEDDLGNVTLIFHSTSGEPVQLDGIPKPHADAVARSLTRISNGGPSAGQKAG
jgi:hypothetical protein